MKKLYLVRHAKSSWRHDGVRDLDRPLKGRGIRDAYNTSEWLRNQDEQVELLISSPATRALHTAKKKKKSLNYHFDEIQINEDIYHATSKDLQKMVRQLDDRFNSVMLFGHNPTITEFVNQCIDHRINNVPTTGVACLKFDVPAWRDLSSKADLLFFDYPKRRREERDKN